MERKIKIVLAKPLSEKQQERKTRPEGEEKPPRKTSGSQRGGRGKPSDRKNTQTRKVSYSARHNDERSVYVGHLSYRTTEMKLGRHFEKYGDIKDVRIVEDE